MKLAKINFYKDIEHVHYCKGVTGTVRSIDFQQLEVPFETEDELMNGMALWLEGHYDVSKEDFLKHVNNECDNSRFDYNQCEDGRNNAMTISEDDPEGYLASYQMLVTSVLELQAIDYKFKTIGGN